MEKLAHHLTKVNTEAFSHETITMLQFSLETFKWLFDHGKGENRFEEGINSLSSSDYANLSKVQTWHTQNHATFVERWALSMYFAGVSLAFHKKKCKNEKVCQLPLVCACTKTFHWKAVINKWTPLVQVFFAELSVEWFNLRLQSEKLSF